LKEKNITQKDEGFKKIASLLFNLCKKNLQTILSLPSSEGTSEKMLAYLRKHRDDAIASCGLALSKSSDTSYIVTEGKENVQKTPKRKVILRKWSSCVKPPRGAGMGVLRSKSYDNLTNIVENKEGEPNSLRSNLFSSVCVSEFGKNVKGDSLVPLNNLKQFHLSGILTSEKNSDANESCVIYGSQEDIFSSCFPALTKPKPQSDLSSRVTCEPLNSLTIHVNEEQDIFFDHINESCDGANPVENVRILGQIENSYDKCLNDTGVNVGCVSNDYLCPNEIIDTPVMETTSYKTPIVNPDADGLNDACVNVESLQCEAVQYVCHNELIDTPVIKTTPYQKGSNMLPSSCSVVNPDGECLNDTNANLESLKFESNEYECSNEVIGTPVMKTTSCKTDLNRTASSASVENPDNEYLNDTSVNIESIGYELSKEVIDSPVMKRTPYKTVSNTSPSSVFVETPDDECLINTSVNVESLKCEPIVYACPNEVIDTPVKKTSPNKTVSYRTSISYTDETNMLDDDSLQQTDVKDELNASPKSIPGEVGHSLLEEMATSTPLQAIPKKLLRKSKPAWKAEAGPGLKVRVRLSKEWAIVSRELSLKFPELSLNPNHSSPHANSSTSMDSYTLTEVRDRVAIERSLAAEELTDGFFASPSSASTSFQYGESYSFKSKSPGTPGIDSYLGLNSCAVIQSSLSSDLRNVDDRIDVFKFEQDDDENIPLSCLKNSFRGDPSTSESEDDVPLIRLATPKRTISLQPAIKPRSTVKTSSLKNWSNKKRKRRMTGDNSNECMSPIRTPKEGIVKEAPNDALSSIASVVHTIQSTEENCTPENKKKKRKIYDSRSKETCVKTEASVTLDDSISANNFRECLTPIKTFNNKTEIMPSPYMDDFRQAHCYLPHIVSPVNMTSNDQDDMIISPLGETLAPGKPTKKLSLETYKRRRSLHNDHEDGESNKKIRYIRLKKRIKSAEEKRVPVDDSSLESVKVFVSALTQLSSMAEQQMELTLTAVPNETQRLNKLDKLIKVSSMTRNIRRNVLDEVPILGSSLVLPNDSL